MALLYASRELDKLITENFDQRIGVQIVQNALKVILSLIDHYFSCIPISHLKVDLCLLFASIVFFHVIETILMIAQLENRKIIGESPCLLNVIAN